jgi:pyridoxine 5-phosphate synthase
MARLAVNVDHVGTLREARKVSYPDPIAAAISAELGGADAITVHLREDRRHIHDRDVRILRKVVQTRLNLKMAATSEMVGIALDIKPDLVTLVPERREELKTEGGLDLIVHKNTVAETVSTLQNSGMAVSIFVDPDPDQIKLVHQTNAKVVEINTGLFCEATTTLKRNQTFSKFVDAVKIAHKLRLGIHAGHGLGYQTLKVFRNVAEIQEFSIGHSIVARAVMSGMEQAVRDMLALIKNQ